MNPVFVDTSGFYAFLDRTDTFHETSKRLFYQSEQDSWRMLTSSFVLHESWALIQARLGWNAVEDWLSSLVPRCEIVWVDEKIYSVAAARTRQARERRLSLTDCSSFEIMLSHNCRYAIADDEHFRKMGFTLPTVS
jgi:uncharacterized protein